MEVVRPLSVDSVCAVAAVRPVRVGVVIFIIVSSMVSSH